MEIDWRVCEACGYRGHCLELRGRWFCMPCHRWVRDRITRLQEFCEMVLRARGVI